MAEDGWTPTDIEEPATTSTSTVGIDTPDQPDRRRTTAGRRRTSKNLPPHQRLLSVDTPDQPDRRRTTAGRRRASNSESPHQRLLSVDTPGQPDRWLDIDGHTLSLI